MSIYSNQVERHVLGGLLKFPHIFVDIDTFLSEKDFYNEVHQTIYLVIRDAILEGEKVDKVLIANNIKNLGVSFKDDINIFDYVDTLGFTQITKAAALKSCRELSKLRICREVYETFQSGQDYIKQNLNKPIDEIISSCDSIYGDKISSYILGEQPTDVFEELENLVEERGNTPLEENGHLTPYPEFNRLYGGLMPGNLYAFVARPGQGKSTFINDLCMKTALKNKVKVLVLDTEMSTEETQFRLTSSLSGVPLWYVQTGNWRKNEGMIAQVRAAMDKIREHNNYYYHFHIKNKPIEQVCSIIRRWYYSKVGRGNPCIIAYDYVKLTGEKVSQNWAEHQAIGQKIDILKKIAEEINAPIVTAMQLNRAGESFNRKSAGVVDDATAISLSDRLQWFASFVGIFRRKTVDEIARDTTGFGTHKLIPLKTRHQGRDASGHQDLFQRLEDPNNANGNSVWAQNYVNFNVENFNVEEKGSLIDIIRAENNSFSVEDSNPNDESGTL
jgi:replicative DNA helicase